MRKAQICVVTKTYALVVGFQLFKKKMLQHTEWWAIFTDSDLFGMKPKHEEMPSTQLFGQHPKQSITGTMRKCESLTQRC